MEEDELGGDMCPRKDAGDRTIYATRHLREYIGKLYLCDLGEAIIGEENVGPAMPTQYRAPEVIFGMKWGHAIDMWSVGMMVCGDRRLHNWKYYGLSDSLSFKHGT